MKNKIAQGFSAITVFELPVLARVIHDNSSSNEETLLFLECIDDLLLMQKMRLFMHHRRKNGKAYREVLEGRIGKLTEDLLLLNNKIL